MPLRRRAWLPFTTLLAAALSGCGGTTGTAEGAEPAVPEAPAAVSTAPLVVRFGGFSALREAFASRVLPAFATHWRRDRERAVAFRSEFTGSELLTGAILEGLAIDVAVLSLPRDADALAAAGLAAADWRQRPHGGIVCRSLVVLAVRKGNPKGIHDWADLARPDVQVVTPSPASSGGGIWNVCALHGAALRGHAGVPAGDHAAARAFVARVFANAVATPTNAADAFRAFQRGIGDVAITYESEVTLAWVFGHDEERVIPASTLLVENPAVLLATNARSPDARAAAQALLDWLWSREAQRHLAACGLRPVEATAAAQSSAQFPAPRDAWRIDDLGDWPTIEREVLTGHTTPAAPRPGR